MFLYSKDESLIQIKCIKNIFFIFYSSTNPEKIYIYKNMKQHNCFPTLIIIRNVSWAYYNDFWRSCDTEDWSNDAENSALITGINYIFQNIQIYLYLLLILLLLIEIKFHNIMVVYF